MVFNKMVKSTTQGIVHMLRIVLRNNLLLLNVFFACRELDLTPKKIIRNNIANIIVVLATIVKLA